MTVSSTIAHDRKHELTRPVPSAAFVDYWGPLLNLNQSFVEDIHTRSKKCGYDKFMSEAMVFPPKKALPAPPNANQTEDGCSIWNDVIDAATLTNPCFDVYDVATTCPLLWDVLGKP